MRLLRLLPLLIPVFGTQAADTSLQTALAHLDGASAKFRGLRADVRRLTHTEVVHVDEVETGKMAVKRQGNKDLRMKIAIEDPNPRTVWFLGNKVQVYYPKSNNVQEYGLGKANALKDQFMALGFGNTSKDLNAGYTLQPGGPETVAGQQTIRIVLIPKDQKMRSLFPKIELWLSDEGVVVQQKLYEPGGADFIISTYTKIEQTNITDADVKVDFPKNAKIEKPLN